MPTPTNRRGGELATLCELAAEAPWDSALGLAHHETAAILESVDIALLLDQLKANLNDAPGIADLRKSVEKTTHYKWFLAEDPAERFEVWLHEYKPSSHRREGHATVAHNHRFWLTSLILREGFTDTRYERTDPTDSESGAISAIESRRMDAGDTMVLDPDEIHALSGLSDGTFSLIVQGQPIRNFSEVFEGGEVRRYFDLSAKREELKDLL